MFDVLCITNRALCKDDFFTRIERIAEAKPAGIILREKDLSEAEYMKLANQVLNICQKYGTPCVLHSFVKAAEELHCTYLHLPLEILRTLSAEKRARFASLGSSCHSIEDAIEAEKLGCTYITAGHVFDTNCKKGLPGRGLDFLRGVCESISIPVYAIGGINIDNISEARKCGAAGVCVMSGAMICKDVQKYICALKEY